MSCCRGGGGFSKAEWEGGKKLRALVCGTKKGNEDISPVCFVKDDKFLPPGR